MTEEAPVTISSPAEPEAETPETPEQPAAAGTDQAAPRGAEPEGAEPEGAEPSGTEPPPTPFHNLDDYISLPRVNALAASPDGSRIVAAVGALNKDATKWVTNLWSIDPEGGAPVRLTRGAKGESTVAFTPNGDLLFVAARPGEKDEDDSPAALWLLPRAGGEPRVVARHPGGISGVIVRGNTALVTGQVLPGSTDLDNDKERRKARKDKKVTAILHTRYPVRHWDADLGPDETRFYVADLTDLTEARAGAEDPTLTLRDITADAGPSLQHASPDLAWDGSFVVSEWTRYEPRGDQRAALVRIDTATGERTFLVDEPRLDAEEPRIAPDGRSLAYVRSELPTPEQAPRPRLMLRDLTSGTERELLGGWDNWPGSLQWLPSGEGLIMAADNQGRSPLFYVPADGGAPVGTTTSPAQGTTTSPAQGTTAPAGSGVPVRLTEDGAYSSLTVTEDGSTVYALRTSYEYPNEPVRVSLTGVTDPGFREGTATVTTLDSPSERPKLPGTLTEIETTAEDGARVRAFLALPAGAGAESPAPLLLWIHGGPLGSWNAWSWRWNPWNMVAAGYAVLLPDPALSTGYGQEFIQRGWGSWGHKPYTDLMSITDTATAREDIDSGRTAAMGGSFGGYMANWVAGHTDRFRAIVTHASLWALDQFGPTTDAAFYWERNLSRETGMEHSPHLSVGEIRTPVLVIHGDKDYRVPIGEGLRLWYELLSRSGLPAGEDGESPHRFLYYPDENHWILSPQNSKVWYEVVLAFLAEHVLDDGPAEVPELLR
ncbi:MAG TPA: prolyl oligopeptidase family serine peptidase [Actinomycetales bacterium]|nr:prolyl oligopeptidase family serine peptidase [Actinomycetales bacterium]